MDSVDNGIFIHAIVPRHVETCALLSKLQGEEHIETGISLSKREIGGQK